MLLPVSWVAVPATGSFHERGGIRRREEGDGQARDRGPSDSCARHHAAARLCAPGWMVTGLNRGPWQGGRYVVSAVCPARRGRCSAATPSTPWRAAGRACRPPRRRKPAPAVRRARGLGGGDDDLDAPVKVPGGHATHLRRLPRCRRARRPPRFRTRPWSRQSWACTRSALPKTTSVTRRPPGRDAVGGMDALVTVVHAGEQLRRVRVDDDRVGGEDQLVARVPVEDRHDRRGEPPVCPGRLRTKTGSSTSPADTAAAQTELRAPPVVLPPVPIPDDPFPNEDPPAGRHADEKRAPGPKKPRTSPRPPPWARPRSSAPARVSAPSRLTAAGRDPRVRGACRSSTTTARIQEVGRGHAPTHRFRRVPQEQVP
jgi:hypothetical protein